MIPSKSDNGPTPSQDGRRLNLATACHLSALPAVFIALLLDGWCPMQLDWLFLAPAANVILLLCFWNRRAERDPFLNRHLEPALVFQFNLLLGLVAGGLLSWGAAWWLGSDPLQLLIQLLPLFIVLFFGLWQPVRAALLVKRGKPVSFPFHELTAPLTMKFLVLRSAPRELWIILIAYILENIAYKLSSGQVLPLWLRHDLGFPDKSKGFTIGIWSALLTLITVMVGSFTDAAGIRRTFLLGFIICLFARVGMMITNTPWAALAFGMVPLAFGLALMSPVMTAAMKRYSNAAQRSLAFSLYYALMNLGFAIGDRLFDHFRHVMGEYGTWHLPGLGADLSTYRVMILWSVIFTVPGMILTWFFLRDGVEMTEKGVTVAPRKAAAAGKNFLETSLTSIRETGAKTVQIFAGLWGQKPFYRFLAFMALVVGVRMVFYHLNYTLPDFAIRELGKGAPLAQVSSMLNSLLILAFVPVCGVLTAKFSAYRMVTVGSFISAISVLFLAVPPEWFQSLADGWLGDFICHKWLHVSGAVNPIYIAIFLFTVGLSIGEALWSPRLYEYAASIAPKGQEASYMALSVLPYFFAKLGAGTLSGVLLSDFCPETGPRNPQLMWYLVACMAVITPLGTILLRKYIQVQEAGREPVISKAEAAVEEEEAER